VAGLQSLLQPRTNETYKVQTWASLFSQQAKSPWFTPLVSLTCHLKFFYHTTLYLLMSSAFIYAISSSLRAITTIINKSFNNGTPTLARSARHASYMGVSSTNELIELILSDYCSILTAPLHALVSLVIKLAGVWTMLATYWLY